MKTKTWIVILVGASLTLACPGSTQQNHPTSANASVQPGEPVQVVDAKYPKKARKQKVQGPVTLHVIVAADGSVKQASILKGDPLLTDAAVEAVRKWRFQPFVADGKPITGERDVTINFRLGNDSKPYGPACNASMGPLYKPGAGLSLPKVVYSRDPDYDEGARQAKVQGSVTLKMVVAPDGHTCDISVTTSLDRALDEKAVEAVRTWRFKPAEKDGQPVAVEINVQTQFHLY
jgi:TonB family protein